MADRGYYDGREILACEEAGITVTLPKAMTAEAKAEGEFGKQDFVFARGWRLSLPGRRVSQILLH